MYIFHWSRIRVQTEITGRDGDFNESEQNRYILTRGPPDVRIKIRGTWRRTCTHAMHFYVNGVGHIFRVVTTTAARVHIIFNCSKLKRASALL